MNNHEAKRIIQRILHWVRRCIRWVRANVSGSTASLHRMARSRDQRWARHATSGVSVSGSSHWVLRPAVHTHSLTASNFLTTKFWQTKNSTINPAINRKKSTPNPKKSNPKYKKSTKNRPKSTPKTTFFQNGPLKTLTKMKFNLKTNGKTRDRMPDAKKASENSAQNDALSEGLSIQPEALRTCSPAPLSHFGDLSGGASPYSTPNTKFACASRVV